MHYTNAFIRGKKAPFRGVFKYKDKDTDNSGGVVWEWIDVPVDESLLIGIHNLASSELTTCKLRLSGKYTDERDITPTEKAAFQQVLDAYEYLYANGNTGIEPPH